MTISEFNRKLRAGETSAGAITDECLRKIEADNPRLNAFIHVMARCGRTLVTPTRISPPGATTVRSTAFPSR